MKYIEVANPDGSGTIKVSERRLADPAVAEHYGIKTVYAEPAEQPKTTRKTAKAS